MKIPTREEQNRWLDAYVKPLMQGDLTTLVDNYHRRKEGLLTRTDIVAEFEEIKDDLFEAESCSDEQSGKDVRNAVQRLREVVSQAESYLSSGDEVSEVGGAVQSILFSLGYVQKKDQPRSIFGWPWTEVDLEWKLPNDHLLDPAKPYSERGDQDLYAHLTEKLQRLDDLENGRVTEKELERDAHYEWIGRRLQSATTDDERQEVEFEFYANLLEDLFQAIQSDPELRREYAERSFDSSREGICHINHL